MCLRIFRKGSNWNVRDLWCIRRYLDLESTQLLATALVSSRLNYCNLFLHGIATVFKISLMTCKTVHEKQPVYLHSVLAALLHPIHWSQTKELFCRSLGSRRRQVQEHFILVSLEQPPTLCLFSHFHCYLKKHFKIHLFDLALSPVTPAFDGPLILWNCVIDFVVEHQFGCCATEPGFAGDNGVIEIWLIDW